jgi:4-hydroxy-tetrahydrodipicolinate synthase
MLRLTGMLPPMVTPLDAEERIDEAGLVRQVERLIAGGVHGIYLLGTTGEAAALRESEKQRAIQATLAQVAGRVPVVVGCMASSTRRAVEQVERAAKLGATAVAVTPPHYYANTSEPEILAHYRAVAASTALPLLIYNIPQTTKVMISAEVVRGIAEIENVVGIKDSSGDWSQALKLLFYLREDPGFSVLFGSAQIAGPALLFGAEGAVIGIGNVDPARLVRLYAAASQGRVEETYAIQKEIQGLMRLQSYGGGIACIKAALDLMGVCASHVTQPFQPVPEENRPKIAAVLREYGLL